MDIGDLGHLFAAVEKLLEGLAVDDRLFSRVCLQQEPQRIFDPRFTFLRRQFQYLQIAVIAAPRRHTFQQVVNSAKLTAREQVFTVAIVGEGTRFRTHQSIMWR